MADRLTSGAISTKQWWWWLLLLVLLLQTPGKAAQVCIVRAVHHQQVGEVVEISTEQTIERVGASHRGQRRV